MKKQKASLKLIQREIERLEKQSSETGLSLNDVKALEILIRTGQSLISAPVEPEESDLTDVSDEELDAAVLKSETPDEPK